MNTINGGCTFEGKTKSRPRQEYDDQSKNIGDRQMEIVW